VKLLEVPIPLEVPNHSLVLPRMDEDLRPAVQFWPEAACLECFAAFLQSRMLQEGLAIFFRAAGHLQQPAGGFLAKQGVAHFLVGDGDVPGGDGICLQALRVVT